MIHAAGTQAARQKCGGKETKDLFLFAQTKAMMNNEDPQLVLCLGAAQSPIIGGAPIKCGFLYDDK